MLNEVTDLKISIYATIEIFEYHIENVAIIKTNRHSLLNFIRKISSLLLKIILLAVCSMNGKWKNEGYNNAVNILAIMGGTEAWHMGYFMVM
jgi:hypothetical protein